MISKQLNYWSNLTWKEFLMSILAYLGGQLWLISKVHELFF